MEMQDGHKNKREIFISITNKSGHRTFSTTDSTASIPIGALLMTPWSASHRILSITYHMYTYVGINYKRYTMACTSQLRNFATSLDVPLLTSDVFLYVLLLHSREIVGGKRKRKKKKKRKKMYVFLYVYAYNTKVQ